MNAHRFAVVSHRTYAGHLRGRVGRSLAFAGLAMSLVLIPLLVTMISGTVNAASPAQLVRSPAPSEHLAAPGPLGVTLNGWTSLYPDLWGISAVSADEAWAAGVYGQLYHYTAGAWISVDVPAMSGLTLLDIKMHSASSGWVVAGYRAFHYDGTAWAERSNGLGFSVASLYSVEPVGPNEAWAVGYTGSRRAVVHWDGTQWTPTGPVLPSSAFMDNIAMSGPTEGWATGQVYINSHWQGLLYHYDGTDWQQVSNPLGVATPRGIWTSSLTPGEAWMSGGDSSSPGVVYHYSNGSWSPTYTASRTVPGSLFMLSANEGWATVVQPFTGILHWDGSTWSTEYTSDFYLRSITGAPGRVWAAGNGSTIVSRTGAGSWAHVQGSPTFNSLNGVSTLSLGEAWAVGAAGTTLRYSGGSWQPVPTGFSNILYDVQMLSSSDGYAVGTNAIAHWDGAAWSLAASPSAYLRGVAMTAPGEGWAVGSAAPMSGPASIWRATGGNWEPVSTAITRTLYAVAMDSPSHGWAVGGDLSQLYSSIPALVEYSNGSWIDRSASAPAGAPILRDIVLAPGGKEGWAVGSSLANDERSILHLKDGVWTVVPYGDRAQLNSVSMLDEQDVWAMGPPAFHLSGGSWSQVALPISGGIAGVSLIPGFGGWAVGPYGSILRYDQPGADPTPTNTPLPPTHTPVPTNTPRSTATPPPPTTAPPTNTPPETCAFSFTDVQPADYFYQGVRYLYCHNAISGYADNTFRPYNNATRGQVAKIVVLAEGFPVDTHGAPHFRDVPAGHAFLDYIETAYNRGIVSGYSCGSGCLEFRPASDVTRAQLCKIMVLAEGWAIDTANGPHFADVPVGSAFYEFVETAYNRGVISGYGSTFRPGSNATRGQIGKIVYNAITQP
jgi:hypothetical protein